MSQIMNLRKKPYSESYLTQLFRFFSYPFTYLLCKINVTPNQISFFSFILVLFSAYLFSTGLSNYLVVGGLIYFFSAILDHSDGEVARVKGVESKFGMWFDGVLDRVGDVFVLIGISIGVFVKSPKIEILILVLFAVISTTIWRFLTLYTDSILNFDKNTTIKAKKIGFDAPMMYFLVTLAALFDKFVYLLLFFAILVNLAWVRNLIIWSIKYRKT